MGEAMTYDVQSRMTEAKQIGNMMQHQVFFNRILKQINRITVAGTLNPVRAPLSLLTVTAAPQPDRGCAVYTYNQNTIVQNSKQANKQVYNYLQ